MSGFQVMIFILFEAFQFVDRAARREEERLIMSLCWLHLEKLNITSEVCIII